MVTFQCQEAGLQEEVAQAAIPLMAIAAAFAIFDGIQVVMNGALRGAGDVRVPFLLNISTYWLIGLPVAVGSAFALDLGVRGLWYGFTCLSNQNALIANCSDRPHDPTDTELRPEDDPGIPHRW